MNGYRYWKDYGLDREAAVAADKLMPDAMRLARMAHEADVDWEAIFTASVHEIFDRLDNPDTYSAKTAWTAPMPKPPKPKRSEQVFIKRTDENGELLYAVARYNDPEFWLNAFELKKDALAFCKRYQLVVRKLK